jgi:hypothetical protein
MWGRGFHWVNLVADGILPQRTNLYGLPAALMIFTLFAAVWSHGRKVKDSKDSEADREGEGLTDACVKDDEPPRGIKRPGETRVLLVAGLLAGLLPLFHMHAYFAVGFVSVALFALRPSRSWLAFWIPGRAARRAAGSRGRRPRGGRRLRASTARLDGGRGDELCRLPRAQLRRAAPARRARLARRAARVAHRPTTRDSTRASTTRPTSSRTSSRTSAATPAHRPTQASTSGSTYSNARLPKPKPRLPRIRRVQTEPRAVASGSAGIINVDGQDLQDKAISDLRFQILNPAHPVHPC